MAQGRVDRASGPARAADYLEQITTMTPSSQRVMSPTSTPILIETLCDPNSSYRSTG